MRKNQLINLLNSIKGNPEICLSSDAEGNSFHDIETPFGGKQDEKGSVVLVVIYPSHDEREF